MAQLVSITCPAAFNALTDTTSLASRWTKWVSGFETYILAAGITSDNQKRAILLHCAGEAVQEIFGTLPDKGTSCAHAIGALNAYFKPKKNKHFERHLFRSCSQKDDEKY